MTREEFKKLKPELAHLEGDSLWNSMEDYMLTIQQGEEIARPILPFWKRYTIRWLFYRKLPNLIYSKYSDSRCKHCKYGGGTNLIWRTPEGAIHGCGKPYETEPNTNWDYKLYKATAFLKKYTIDLFWGILDFLHIVRSTNHGRHDMFGDESRYVKSWAFDKDWNKKGPIMIKRKWWEYIFIEKRQINL